MLTKLASTYSLLAIIIIAFLALPISKLQGTNQPRELYPYSFGGLENLPVNEAVDLLTSLGYKGVIPDGRTAEDINRFQQYLDRSDAEGDNFKIPAYYLNHKVYLPDQGYNDTVHRQVIDILAARGGGTLWMAVRAVKNSTDIVDFDRVNNFIKGVFEYATGEDSQGNYRNVNIVFYPHVNNAYESTVEAMSLVEEINDPRFTVSINLVHEYHAGRSDPVLLADTFNRAQGRIGAVILCGIKTSGDFSILSLENTEHALEPFMELVRDSEYKGPIGFINFAIPEDTSNGVGYPEEYLSGSISEWSSLSNAVNLSKAPDVAYAAGITNSGSAMALSWSSKMGKFYDVLSSTDLVNWTVHNDGVSTYSDLPTTGLGTNVLANMQLLGSKRFFKIREKDRPSN